MFVHSTHTTKQTNKQTNKQPNNQPTNQPTKQTNKQTNTHTHTLAHKNMQEQQANQKGQGNAKTMRSRQIDANIFKLQKKYMLYTPFLQIPVERHSGIWVLESLSPGTESYVHT